MQYLKKGAVMKPIDVLAMVANGEIPDSDIERSKDIWGIRFDESLHAGFLLFGNGTLLKVNPERYEYLVALSKIMNTERKLWGIGLEVKGIGKVLKHIHEHNQRN